MTEKEGFNTWLKRGEITRKEIKRILDTDKNLFILKIKSEYPNKYVDLFLAIDEMLCKYPNGIIPEKWAGKVVEKHNVKEILEKEELEVMLKQFISIAG